MNKQESNVSTFEIEDIDFEVLEELEEVITPGWGTHTCCY